MTAISMMGFIAEERTRKELSSTTPRDWTLSYIHDLHPVNLKMTFILSASLLWKKSCTQSSFVVSYS